MLGFYYEKIVTINLVMRDKMFVKVGLKSA